MKNREIAAVFSRIADALDIKGEPAFKILAYRRAARILDEMAEDVAVLAADNRLCDVEGIGDGLASKIVEYLKTGRMAKADEAAKGLPAGLFDLLNVPGLGAKTVGLAFKALGVAGLDDLRRVIADGSLAALKGMGEKKAENILKGIGTLEKGRERLLLGEAAEIAEEVIAELKRAAGGGRIEAAGSLRRMRETIGDIDILASVRNGEAVIGALTGWNRVRRVLAAGDTKASVLIEVGNGERQVDLRFVEPDSFGAALQYFTGSKAHNVKLRGLAKDLGLKVNEYGVFRGERKAAGREETDVYKALGLPWIPPELREDRGEIERAREGRLPTLIERDDIRGDLHCHTTASDGRLKLAELADLMRAMGYGYAAVCDHSRSARYAGGLTPERLKAQGAEIDALNRKLKGFRILKGTEVDILPDGTVDFPEPVLAGLDFVVASVHSSFKRDVTARMIKALANPHVDMIGHPSGRLLSGREGYDVDLEKVIEAARIHGKAMELNSHIDRLDLDDVHLRLAKDKGVPIGIGTDTHGADGPAMIRFGLGTARRGWLEKTDVLNTLSAAGLARWRNKRTGEKRRP
ncbi:MAG: DNA polymerase/3'-5' exonuclease PolX [Acidobacteriota bacterium]|nr:DNA polymerase/3'-5' exonuclease PolX [Acidobacteriota bacterium]